MKLDLKDKKILYELDKNARATFPQIAKAVGLSPEAVFHRVKKLEKEKIILQYQTAVNYSKLNLIHFKICLKYNGIPLSTEEKIYSKLEKIPQIIWIVKTSGEYDSMISCTVNSISELNQIKDKIISITSKHAVEKTLSILSNLWSFPRNYLINKKTKTTFESKGTPSRIDDLDLKILKILSENARKPIVDIAKELESTVKIITTRIKKLLKTGIINNFRLVLNYEKLEIHFHKTLLYIKNPEEKRLDQLLLKLNTNPNVIHNLKTIGEWDLEPEFEFHEKDNLQETTQELMNEFSDIIQKINTIKIIKEYKFTFFHKSKI